MYGNIILATDLTSIETFFSKKFISRYFHIFLRSFIGNDKQIAKYQTRLYFPSSDPLVVDCCV